MAVNGVRVATVADAEGMGTVNVESWRQRLEGILPTDLLEHLSADELSMTWASSLLNPPVKGQRAVVAIVGTDIEHEKLVGYAAFGPSQEPDALPGEYELVALEVAPERHRQGHGSRLMTAALDLAREAGAESAIAWCPLDDSIRREFLQSAGWAPDSAFRDLATGTDAVVREVRLATSLATG